MNHESDGPGQYVRQLTVEADHLVAQSRAIRALIARLCAEGRAVKIRLMKFKAKPELRCAEEKSEPLILAHLMHRVCNEGELLQKLLEKLEPPARSPRT